MIFILKLCTNSRASLEHFLFSVNSLTLSNPINKQCPSATFLYIVKIHFNTFAFPLCFGRPTITFCWRRSEEGHENWVTFIVLPTKSIPLYCACVRWGVQQTNSNIFWVFWFLWRVDLFQAPSSLCFISLNIFQVFALTAGGTLLRNKDFWMTTGWSLCLNTC